MNMLLKSELEPIIAGGYSEGQVRFGDLGLPLPTYTDRVGSIVRKHLGQTPPTDHAISFVKALHSRDLYLATACAQSSPGINRHQLEPERPEHTSVAWKMLETTYKGLIWDLV